MKHIGFYLDGLNLMEDGKVGGINCTLKVRWNLTLKNNGSLEIVDNMEIGNE